MPYFRWLFILCMFGIVLHSCANKPEMGMADIDQKVISLGAGISVSSAAMQADLMSQKDRFSSFPRYTTTASYGRIIEEQEPKKWTQQEIGKDRNGLPIMKYQVTLQCKVQREEGSPDPGFSIRMDLNKATFLESDKIEITIYPTQNCFLIVFNLYETENKVLVLFPNDVDKDNKCEANKVKMIPNGGIRPERCPDHEGIPCPGLRVQTW